MVTLHVLSIHGVSDKKYDSSSDYAQALEQRILSFLPKEIADRVVFDRVDYSDISLAERELVESHEIQPRGFLEELWNNLLGKTLRKLLVSAGGNVLAYEASESFKAEIRQRVLDKVVDINQLTTIIGHSLGSVVAFDVAYYQPGHDWQGKYVTNLFLMGSPLALFTLDKQNPKYAQSVKVVSGQWVNFYSSQDVISYPLKWQFDQAEDVQVSTGLFPTDAHNKYWSNADVAKRIAEVLVMDYKAQKQKEAMAGAGEK